jgi:signal transduction histidine kinase
MKAYYAILDPSLLPPLVYTRVRDVLSQEGGVRLYRNGFRVVPYGEPENDWLGLDAAYVKRAALAPIANRNFFGVIELYDPEGSLFEEHTSREGLIETPAFRELQGVASSVLITAATQIARDRGRKTHAGRGGSKPPLDAATRLDEVTLAAKAARDAAARAAKSMASPDADIAAQRAAETVKLIEEHQEQFEATKAQLADESAMLRFLATLGMTTAEFTHETGMTFDAFRLDFQRVFEVAYSKVGDDAVFAEQAERARSMLHRLETLTSYLNTLAAARSLRGMSPVSLSKAVEDFKRGLSDQALSQSVTLLAETPPYDALFTRPMHQAEIASILLNFYTNAVKAMKRSNGERRILVLADRDESNHSVRIRFSDTGDGIPIENRERIFDAFFTTIVAPSVGSADIDYASGTGLGLWIVRQIVENVGGEVSVGDGPAGYSTCLEVLLPSEEDSDE